MRRNGGSPAPKAGRPMMPEGYGIHTGKKGLLAWSHVEKRMAASHNYWIGTTCPDGRPHVMPVWGVWIGRKFYFGTDRNSRKSRNLLPRPAVVVHLESAEEVVILEGVAAEVTERKRLAAIDQAYLAKYGMGLTGHPGAPIVFGVSPHTAFAWSEKTFPSSATRWKVPPA